MSKRIRNLGRESACWPSWTVVGFIKDLSSGCVAISRGDRASCLGCGCHRPHMPGSGAACPGLRCPARSQGRLLSLYRLEARIIVVDPGFMVDPGYPRAPDPPRSPDPPRKPENPSAWRGGSGSCGGCDVQGRGRGDHALTVARWLTGGQAGPLHTAGVLPSAWPVCGKAGWPRLPAPARSQESRRERGLDHQTTRWTGRTIGEFIKDASFGQADPGPGPRGHGRGQRRQQFAHHDQCR